MSELMKQIKEDLTAAMKHEVKCRTQAAAGGLDNAITQKTISRTIISMCPEIGKKPGSVTDDEVLKLLKKFISQQKERQLYIQRHLTEADVKDINAQQLKKLVADKFTELGDSLTSPEIEVAKKYLPKAATEEEVTTWIQENLDLSTFKNKMQAMGPIMKQFRGADGNFIKGILLSL